MPVPKTKMHYAQPNKDMMEFLRVNVRTRRPRHLSVSVKHALERMRDEEQAMERVLDAYVESRFEDTLP